MSVVAVRHTLFAADELPVAGRTVTAELIAPAPFLANHTGSIIVAARATSDAAGLVELKLTPQLEIAASGTHYVVRVAGTKLEWHCVVPNSGPVQLANILVDPDTLNPVAPEIASLFIPRVERGVPNGVAPLGSDGLVPEEFLPAGGGGGAVDSVNGKTGAVVLDATDVGAAPTGRQVLAGAGLTGGGTLAADRTLALNATTQASLVKADTAVQPGQLAAVATSGAYADLTGKPSIPDSPDDIGAAAAVHGHAIADVTGLQTVLDGKQAADADLSTIAALAPANGALLQRISGAWGAQTIAGLRSDLAVDQVDNTSDTAKPVSTLQQAAINARIPASLVDAKGDLIAGSAADTVTRVAVGADGQVLLADSSQASGLRWGAAGGDRIAYEPSAYGYLDWTTDPLACSADFPHNSGVLLMVRFRYRGSATTISELGFAVTSAASGPGAFSGVALYADGSGVVSRLGQSADAGAQWTSQGPKSIALTAPATVIPGNYYRAALLWQGSGSGRIAGPPTVILDALLNHTVRRSTYLTGQTGFPATVDVSGMNTNNTAYFMSMK